MKIVNSIYIAIVAFVLFASSCTKENVDITGVDVVEPETEQVEVNPLLGRSDGDEDGLSLDCFSIDYPFNLVDEDGIIYNVASAEDFEALITDEDLVCADFEYPLNITYEDGETDVIVDGEALAGAFAACIPDGGWEEGDFPAYSINYDNSCYSLQYPVTLVDFDGVETIVNDEDEFNTAVSEDVQFFVFPISIEHEDGTQVSINDSDELFGALISCGGWEPGDSTGIDWETGFIYLGCYSIDFPLDIVTSDGDVVTINNHEELCDIMLLGTFAGYAFPLTLVDLDGNETVVNSEEELEAAIEDCPGYYFGDESFILLLELLSNEEMSDCYTVNYPVVVNSTDGTSTTINSSDELESFLQTNIDTIEGVELPLNITLTDGTAVEINDLEEFFTVLENCF